MHEYSQLDEQYRLINKNIRNIISNLDRDHVDEYDYLIANRNECQESEYQKRYRRYWRLNTARISPDSPYSRAYFEKLSEALKKTPDMENLMRELYEIPTHSNGRKSNQFSFITKLLHVAKPDTPIYDRMVVNFYGFQYSARGLDNQIEVYKEFHKFLVEEYKRILKNGLLDPSIREFRKAFNPKKFKDEKVIDSLIWAYESKREAE